MIETAAPPRQASLRIGSAAGRWTLLVTVLASGIAFLDGSVVNVALHTIRLDLNTDLSGIQWVVDAYLLTLGALLVLGGSLGDIFGRRRVLVLGIAGFAAASLLCGIAPNVLTLNLARAVQGVAGAMLVPGSLAIISASFHPDDRGRAIGTWSGATSAVFAVGPFVGGYLIQLSWRLVFLINLPIAVVTVIWALRHVPETRDESSVRRPDVLGAVAISLGLGGVVYGLIEGPSHGWTPATVAITALGGIVLALFPIIEMRVQQPMVPLSMFRSLQFSGANLVTLTVYSALGVATFLGVTFLQDELSYSPLNAGIAFVPVTIALVLLSGRMGALTSRIGPRWPMTVGPIGIGIGMWMLSHVADGSSYFSDILPGVCVFGLGLAVTVAPLTTAVLSSIQQRQSGVGSAINTAVARVAGLLGIAVLPALSGLAAASGPHTAAYVNGYHDTMVGCAVLAFVGAGLAALTIRSVTRPEDAPLGDAVAAEAAG